MGHPGGGQQIEAASQVAERHPVDGHAGSRGGGRLQLRRGLFLHRNHGDGVPEAAGGVEHQERKAAVAGDQPELHASSWASPGSSARRVGRFNVTPRAEVRTNCTRYSTSGLAVDGSAAMSSSARAGAHLGGEQVAVGPLQPADPVGVEAAPHQPDAVDAVDLGAVADRLGERQRVLGHHRVAADEGVAADAAELVHAGVGADLRVVLDRDVPAQRRAGPEDGVAADPAVVRDVRVGHDQVAIADRGDARRRRRCRDGW